MGGGGSLTRSPTALSLRFRAGVEDRAMFIELIKQFLRDETGGEVLEYSLIAGLIVVAAIGVIGKVGGKVLARWNSLNSSM